MRRPLSIILNLFQDLPRPALVLAALLLAPTLHAACTGPVGQAGTVIYNSSYNVIQYCNGTNWINTGNKNASAANTGCTNPTGIRGDVIYNTTAKVTQFCNGEAWQNMACSRTATSGGSGCTNPVGLPGTLSFVTPANKLQMCDGTSWLNTGMPCGPLPPALYCWGFNNTGQLGDGTTTDSSIPVKTITGNFSQLFVGNNHNCGINTNGQSYCWGAGTWGNLGNGSSSNSLTSVPVTLPAGVTRFQSITAGSYHYCAIGNNNKSYCWGYGNSGRLGNGSTSNQSTPVEVTLPSGVTHFTALSAGTDATCGIGNNGRAYCWGYGGYGQLGNGGSSDSSTPVIVNLPSGVSSFAKISSGAGHTCAIANNARAYCWGANANGQLGNNDNTTLSSPVAVDLPSGVTNYTDISTGFNFTCAIGNNNSAYCWGANSYGQLGNNTTADVYTPTNVNLPSGVSHFKTIYASGGHACALANNNQIYCWGRNNYGQLGIGSTVNTPNPTIVNTPSGVTGFARLFMGVGSVHTCAIVQ